ncbi:MAG TPA: MFS transporter [Gaiellales bacterium]|nr:MFS transporter [Gaiellales bacterium]
MTVRLGLRANAAQFSLLVGLNALVGAMVGLERSVLPLVGQHDFGLRSKTAIMAFVLAFGIAKACTNLAAGSLAEQLGRKRVLVVGWLAALPVPLLIGLAPSWGFIVAANVLLGINQGLAWSMTVVMKIDLAGPARRGLALGLNEAAGYLGVAATAFLTGVLAAGYAPRTVVWVGATIIALAGTVLALLFVRDTGAHVELEQRGHGSTAEPHTLRTAFAHASLHHPVLRSCCQAGLVNNLNDALAWGLAPLYLAAHGASVEDIAVVAAVYPVVWGAGQLATGWLSDSTGRKPLIAGGMLVQAAALGLLVAGDGAFRPSVIAAFLLGVGTAMVYPTLIAAVSDATQPRDRARVVGVYRFWRDFGFALGALIAGIGTDLASPSAAIVVVAVLTAVSGVLVAATTWHSRPVPSAIRMPSPGGAYPPGGR